MVCSGLALSLSRLSRMFLEKACHIDMRRLLFIFALFWAVYHTLMGLLETVKVTLDSANRGDVQTSWVSVVLRTRPPCNWVVT